MMNVLVLLAGSSAAFREAGYAEPKALIEIDGVPLIERALNALQPLAAQGARFTVVVRGDDNRRFHIGMVIRLLMPEAVVVETAGETAGAACTALLAAEIVGGEQPLLIVNGDQIIDADPAVVTAGFQERGLDGGLVVFRAVHPRWSYVKCGPDGLVVEAAEKRPISNLATAGFYWFARGRDFVTAAQRMILKDAHVDGVFYVCPAYNEMVLMQRHCGIHAIPAGSYHSLMTPTLMQRYEERLLAHPPAAERP